MSLRLFYCDHYTIPLPARHKFPAAKYRLLRQALEADALFHLQPTQPAARELIELAHDSDYVTRFLAGTLATGAAAALPLGFGSSALARSVPDGLRSNEMSRVVEEDSEQSVDAQELDSFEPRQFAVGDQGC